MNIIKVQFKMATSCGSVLPVLGSLLVNLGQFTSLDIELGLIRHAIGKGLRKLNFCPFPNFSNYFLSHMVINPYVLYM